MSPLPQSGVRPVPALVGAALINLIGGAIMAWSLFLEPLQLAYGVGRQAASLSFAFYGPAFTVAMLVAPRLFGLAGCAWLALAGCLVAALAVAAAAHAPEMWQVWLLIGLPYALGTGLGFSLSLQVAIAALPARRGLASGISVAMFGGSPVLLAPILSWAIADGGARDGFLALAAVLAGGGLVVWLLLRISGVQIHGMAGRRPAGGEVSRRGLFRALWGGFFLGTLACMMTISHAAAIVQSMGGALAAGTLAAMLAGGANVGGRVLGGLLADLMPARRFLLAGGAVACLSLALMAWLARPEVAVAAVGCIGFAYGMMAGGYPGVIARVYGADQVARVYGRLFTATGFGGPLGGWLGGILYDWRGDYILALSLGAAVAACAFLCSLALPRARDA